MWYVLVVAICVILDQVVKYWTVSNLALFESAPLLPRIVELKYIRNTGGGFSILANHTWFLIAVTAVVMAVVLVILVKKIFAHPLAMWSLTLIFAGGVGNMIDRVRLGYVVDMFNFQFMNYPVFNVADIFVVCGAIGFAVYYILLDDKIQKAKAAAQTAEEMQDKASEEKCDDGTDHSADEQ